MNNNNPFSNDKRPANNPFDVFFNYRKQIKLKRIEVKEKSSKIDDNVFLNILKKGSKDNSFERSNNEEDNKTKYDIENIYKNMRVLSTTKLFIYPKKYYKFPFENDLISKKITLSNHENKMYYYWITAFKSIYDVFKREGHGFKLFFLNQVLIFENVGAGPQMRTKGNFICSILNQNEISYNRNFKNEVIVDGIDTDLVFDMIVNSEINDKTPVPFIFSEHEFENSIMFHTRCRELPVTQSKGVLYYCYFIDGYFFGKDYEFLFDHEVTFNILN